MAKRGYKMAITVPWADNDYSWRESAKLASEQDAFERVPLIFRACQLRVDTLLRVPVYVYEGDTLISETDSGDGLAFENEMLTPIYKASLPNLLMLAEMSYLLAGATYLLKLHNGYNKQKGLQWLNPFTVQMQYRGAELFFWQQIPQTGERFPVGSEFWTVDDFIYMRGFNPSDDLAPGKSAAAVAMSDGATQAAMSKFLANFFESDAIPTTMVILPDQTEESERKRVEEWFKKKLASLRRSVLRVLAVSADVKIEKMTQELQSLDIAAIDEHVLAGVSDAFATPQSLLRAGSGANRSISDNERQSYLNDTIVPRTKFYERMLNPYLKQFGQRIEFAPNEMPEMQEDETRRSSALKALTDAGVPLKAGLDILGYDLSDEAQKLIDAELKRKEDAAKQLQEKLAQPQQPPTSGQQPPSQDGNGQQPPQNGNGQQPPPQNGSAQEKPVPVKVELDRWRRKSISSLKMERGAVVEFQSDVIPADLREQITRALESARSESEVRAAFE